MKEVLITNDFVVEEIGEIEEWVYDIEVEDNHNFFANDILVHNSNYYQFKPLIEKIFKNNIENIDDDKLVLFLKNLDKNVTGPYISSVIEKVVTDFNAYKNVMAMKQEAVAKSGLYYATKMYTLLLLENEGVRYDDPYFKITGLAAKKMIFSAKIRKWLYNLTKILTTSNYKDFFDYFISIQKDFYNSDFDDIARVSAVKFVTDKNVWEEDSKGLPKQVRAAFAYNYVTKNSDIPKYSQPIMHGEKIKYVNLLENDICPYPVVGWPNKELCKNFIYDFNIDKYVDIDSIFDDTILSSLKNIIKLRKINIKEYIEIVNNPKTIKEILINIELDKFKKLNSKIRKYNKDSLNKKYKIEDIVDEIEIVIEKIKYIDESPFETMNDVKKVLNNLSINEISWQFAPYERRVEIEFKLPRLKRVLTKEEREKIEEEKQKIKAEKEAKKAKQLTMDDILGIVNI